MEYTRKQVKQAIKKLEDAEHNMLVMLATLGEHMSENDVGVLVREIIENSNNRCRCMAILEELDKREGE